MPEKIKIESYHQEEIFLLKVGGKEFLGKGAHYLNRVNGEPFVYEDVELLVRVRKLENWAKFH